MFKNILAVLVVLAFATPAMAFDATPFVAGPAQGGVLVQSSATTIDTDGECVNLQPGPLTTSAACETVGTTQILFVKDAIITGLAVTTSVVGDAGFECDLQIEVGATGAAKGTLLNQATSTTVGNSNRQAQPNFLIEAGDFVGVVVTAGSGQACAGSTDPVLTVVIEGYYVD
jgi:hypothetical protein